MLYLSLTFWLLVVVLTAWGVRELWAGMVRPKVFNVILLPGTLVAQLGHVLGLLVTGATVSDTALLPDDESGEPRTTPNPKPRVPVVGPILIALLPLLACGLGIFAVAKVLSGAFLNQIPLDVARPSLPATLTGIFALLHDLLALAEAFVWACARANYGKWETWAFLYLLICLAVRTAPFPGNLRGSLGAIVVLGVSLAALSKLFAVADPRIRSAWAVLNLTIATLMFLLLVSLLVRGIVGMFRLWTAKN